MECLGCQYDLGGLSEHRCPECGRAFDPADRRSYGPPTDRPELRGRLVSGWGIIAGAFPLAAIVVLRALERWIPPPPEMPYAIIGFGLVVCVVAGLISAFLITLALLHRRWCIAAIITGTAAACWPAAIAIASA